MQYTIFILVYYIAVIAALVGTQATFLKLNKVQLSLVRIFIVVVISIPYFVGMSRIGGVDYEAYARAFDGDYSLIPDLGFQAIMYFFNTLGLPFQALMLFVACVTILALYRASKYFSVSFVLLLVLYMLHFAIIRDFAQLRIGFAIALAILALTSKTNPLRYILYAASITIHLTSAVFIVAYIFSKKIAHLHSKRERALLLSGSIICVFILGSSIQYLAFVDPRIDIYLNWKAKSYGEPVEQYQIVFFQLAIVLLAYYSKKVWSDDKRICTLFYLQIIGVAVFLALTDYAIFAFRISNVVLSFYPILLIASLAGLRFRLGKTSISKNISALVFLLVGFVLLSRTASVDILRSISFY